MVFLKHQRLHPREKPGGWQEPADKTQRGQNLREAILTAPWSCLLLESIWRQEDIGALLETQV